MEAIQDKALRIYWTVLAMARQLEANGVDPSTWAKAAALLEKDGSVAAARAREVETREKKIKYHQAQMRPEELARTQAMDKVAQLEAENAALRKGK